ncbi:MAG TPA: hypothetical protein PLD20_12765 [Blastocatellia bacterium]|nr:hypothetical protein [Blastocatellia bacterium]HMZ18799.1 hypothetical protein [Blastocatellia bacterium]HNG29834.1 hypothetical protein [Blastocatellia bacterium]
MAKKRADKSTAMGLTEVRPTHFNIHQIYQGGIMADTMKNTPGTGTQTSTTSGTPGATTTGSMAGGHTSSASAARTAREQSPSSDWGQSNLQSAEQTVKRGMDKGSEMMGKAKDNLGQAYDRASQSVSDTWDQAATYTRSNPGTATMIAFGAGIGVGLLLATTMNSRSRTQRIAPPVIRALSEIAGELFR